MKKNMTFAIASVFVAATFIAAGYNDPLADPLGYNVDVDKTYSSNIVDPLADPLGYNVDTDKTYSSNIVDPLADPLGYNVDTDKIYS